MTTSSVPSAFATARASLAQIVRVAAMAMVAGAMIVLQDVVIASRYAAGAQVDAYQLAVSFPTMAVNVFAGGTLLATMVPRLVHLDALGRFREVNAFVHQVRRAMWWLLLAVCGLWALAFPSIAHLFANGFAATTVELAAQLTWLHLLSLVLSGMSWVEVAVQNSRGRFWLLSLAPAFIPAGTVLGVVIAGDRFGIAAASAGAMAGSAVLWTVARITTRPLLVRDPSEGTLPTSIAVLAKGYAGASCAAFFLGGVLMFDTWMASTLPVGSAATFGYATRPVILSLAFVTTVVGNVLLPVFSRLVAGGQLRQLRRQFLVWTVLLVLVAVPIVAVVFAWANPIVTLLYQRGSFTAVDTANVTAVQRIYMLHVPWFLAAMLGWRLLNSLQRNDVLLGCTVVAFLVNVVADMWFAPTYGLVGIAWGTNLAFAALAVLIVANLVARRLRD